jgi:hypothetical protein
MFYRYRSLVFYTPENAFENCTPCLLHDLKFSCSSWMSLPTGAAAARKAKASKQSANRGWWRVHFHDCPQYDDQPLFHMYGTSVASGARTKVYCKSCFDQDWNQLLAEERQAVELGTISEARSNSILEKIR